METPSPLPAVETGALAASLFHPAVADWFNASFPRPTPAQCQAWPAIAAGRDTLIAAPTGSGKTLAAFLAVLDQLVRQGITGQLRDQVQVVYISPLKALSNDIQRNLEQPLAGIRDQLARLGLPDAGIRSWVRTGDTPAGERERMRRKPPQLLITTPESFYVLLGSESGRRMLAGARTVIVDEIHALTPNKRGAHLALSLERLDALCGQRCQRIGLSATQNPIGLVADFLSGCDAAGGPAAPVALIDAGHQRPRDLAIELPRVPLSAVMSTAVWEQVHERLVELIATHRTTLVFVNTRRMAERIARALSARLGTTAVTAHHGSMAKELRLDAEQRLKNGQLKALVATASLELGIDVGEVDLVCQIGSPRAISTLLQRVGRSGHAIDGTPKGRLFPLSRDDLVECCALLEAVRQGELDRLAIPDCPLDVLAQQLVAEVAAQDWQVAPLYELLRRAWPFRRLARADFDRVVQMLAEGFATRHGRRGALLHHDAINGWLRARRGARTTALTSGGTIPDTADYQVVLEPEDHVVGSVHEDFAVESMAGDVFQLGNTAYRIRRVERGSVRVEDARGQAPNVPFWLGEAPARSDALSYAVSRLRGRIENLLAEDPSGSLASGRLAGEPGIGSAAAAQLVEYLGAARAALGCLPTQDTVVIERFFDEAGGMQLVIHAPFGNRINRAWGLALRKRFCRKFNFELQAAATEDSIVLSLTTAHSFPLDEVARYLSAAGVREVLVQAMLDAPMFITRWRWVAGVALALPRFRAGRRVPPQLLRMQAEDLVAAVFPDQIACFENLSGDREIPEHPLTDQAIADCLHEAMDIEGLERLLARREAGRLVVECRDLTQPSPLAFEVLSARPYAFLDDAPLEERRTQAVMARRWQDPEDAAKLGQLDPEAIARVVSEAWPDPANREELHDTLLWFGFLTADEAAAQAHWLDWLAQLAGEHRVVRLDLAHQPLWIAAERAAWFAARWPAPVAAAGLPAIAGMEADAALAEILRGRLEGLGPVSQERLAAPLGLRPAQLAAPLAALEADGAVLRGSFLAGPGDALQWCDRRLLARIHQYTLRRLRAEIEPVATSDFQRFLFDWQHLGEQTRLQGLDALPIALAMLEGFEAPAKSWETEILPARLAAYEASWLDAQCLAGRTAWARLAPPSSGRAAPVAPVRATPLVLLDRRRTALWLGLVAPDAPARPGSAAQSVCDCLAAQGASFFDELAQATGLLREPLEQALGELVALGLASSDSFGGIRALLVPSSRRRPLAGARRRGKVLPFDIETGGRWSLLRRPAAPAQSGPAREAMVEVVAQALLRRYGVVCWQLLAREAPWLPPWRELLRVFRRMEARGEVRGGRFVAGLSGEQFALADAVTRLREVRRRALGEEWISLSAADPLNLVGVLTPGARVPALSGNRLLYRNGIAVATAIGGRSELLDTLPADRRGEAERRLLRSAARGLLEELL